MGQLQKMAACICGGNNEGGELGDGTEKDRNIPVKVLDNVKTVSLGWRHSGAITKDGSLYMWGLNDRGKLGDGTEKDRNIPVKVLDNVKTVSLGWRHSGAITKDGSLYMWGDNMAGQLGDGTEENRNIPVKVLDNVEKVSLGEEHSGVITKDGSLYMWGRNFYGELGDGTQTYRNRPVKILDNVKEVRLGRCHSGAITKDGSLYMWGDNTFGQLGDGTNVFRKIPVKILDDIVALSLETDYSGAITKDGSLYMWGNNEYGQLGDGTTETRLIPTKISFSTEASTAETYSNADTQTISKAKLLSAQTEILPVSGSAVIAADPQPKETVQTPAFQKTFTGLTPEGLYNFYIMKSRTAQQPFSADNLLYIAQYAADSSGTLAVSCTPKEMTEGMEAFVVGDRKPDLSGAQIEVQNLTYNGREQSVWPKVTYQNKTLVEGVDYILLGDFRVKDAGKYSVTASGMGFYKGDISADYQMLYKNTHSGGNTGGSAGSYYPYNPPAANENTGAQPQPEPQPIDTNQTNEPKQPDNQTEQPDKPEAVVYKKGSQVTDASSGAVYKITKMPYSNGTGGTVSYLESLNKQAAAVTIPAAITLGDMVFKVTNIADGAFQSNKKLTKAVIGNNVWTIGSKAFYRCTKLKTVLVGTRVKTIGAKAFCKCTALTKITLPDRTSVIGNQAFYGCKKLKTATVGKGLKKIGKQAFYACTRLEKIVIPAKVSFIGSKAFYGCSSLKHIICKTKKLTAKNVGSQAFAGTHKKAKVNVPVKELKQYRKLLRAKGLHKKALIRA